MSQNRTAQIALISAGVAVTGLVGYAFYFDYMRRHSAEFRKGIRKSHRKIEAAAEARLKAEKARNAQALRAAAASLRAEEIPPFEQREEYMQEQLMEGERIAGLGPDHSVDAAVHFCRALRVFPQPVELLMAFQRAIEPRVFSLIVELAAMTGGGLGGVGRMGAGGPPRPAEPSLADIDDSVGSASSSSGGLGGSGGWETVNE